MGFPLDRDINYFKYEIGRDGFSSAADFIWSFLASNPEPPPPSFLRPGTQPRSTLLLLCLWFCDGCGRVSAQLGPATDPAMPPSRQPRWTAAWAAAPTACWTRKGRRTRWTAPSSRCPDCKSAAATAWITNSLCVTCCLTHQILCYTLNVESSCSFPQFCSASFSLVERSQMAPTWWNRWDTVTWKVKCQHRACVFMPSGI